MTALKVVDESALVAILFGEDGADAVGTRLQEATLVAPAVLQFEVANACLTKLRRDATLKDVFGQIYAARNYIRIDSLPVDFDAVLVLANETGLTVYDASYLWLARSRNAELVTLDKRLDAVARAI